MSTVPFSRTRRTELEKPLPHNLEAERSILGSLLLNNDLLAQTEHAIKPDDFFLEQNRRIFRRMLWLAAAKQPIELITLTDALANEKELEAAGGPGYVSSLVDGMPRTSSIQTYIEMVKSKSLLRQIIHKTNDIQQRALEGISTYEDLCTDFSLFTKETSNGRRVTLSAVDVKDFLGMDLKPLEFVIAPILPVQGLGMIHSWRGMGKTYFSMELAYCVACGIADVFFWSIPKPRRVLYVDGEMDAPTFQERAQKIFSGHGGQMPERGYLRFITPDLQERTPNIGTKEGRDLIEEHLSGDELIFLDNLSALAPSSTERETDTWMITQEWLLGLRRRGLTIFFDHHSGKSGTQRGWSGREDVLNVTINLRKPENYMMDEGLRCEVHLEKLRTKATGEAAQPFEIALQNKEGLETWVHRPLKHLIERRAFEMFAAGMKIREVAEDLHLSRFQAYRLQKKYGVEKDDSFQPRD